MDCRDIQLQVRFEQVCKFRAVLTSYNITRGAPGSEGKTSWTGKPEVGDYKAVVGGLVGFLDSLGKEPLPLENSHASESSPHYKQAQPSDDTDTKGLELLLAGYSYGSLITSHLPSYEDLAQEVDLALEKSAEYRTCMAGLRGSGQGWGVKSTEGQKCGLLQISGVKTRANHLLLSPLLPPVSGFLTFSMFSSPVSSIMSEEFGTTKRGKVLVLHGDSDVFTSLAKYRKWKKTWIISPEGSDTTAERDAIEITGAGHFWIESGAMDQLRSAIKGWVASLN